MSGLADALALAVTGAGLLVGIGVAMQAGIRAGLSALLEFLLAAGILRLGSAPGWDAIAMTAIVIAIRHLVTAGLSTGHPPSRRSAPARRRRVVASLRLAPISDRR